MEIALIFVQEKERELDQRLLEFDRKVLEKADALVEHQQSELGKVLLNQIVVSIDDSNSFTGRCSILCENKKCQSHREATKDFIPFVGNVANEKVESHLAHK
jgi:hypothetical protein